METEPNQRKPDNSRVISRLLLLAVAMFGFGFALVPLYDVFCSVTGINGKTGGRVSNIESVKIDDSREIKVEFLTSLNEDMPWDFKALKNSVKVHPGQVIKVEFMARNTSDRDITGQAIPSVSPGLAAKYFKKTECFCFSEQKLKAGEEKIMPLVFVVDPLISEDVHEISLSYTFFIKPGTEGAGRGVKTSSVSKSLATLH
ncbi:MAG: cytochrome c oxidase assembly protein [Gammaproteobacteria bacterium]|nr:MAG: cytochrome c oxidase assembly protein [Gammaproteobacteria bacterium]